MSTLAHTETFDRRSRIFARLAVRNRLVAALRVAVPVLGLLVLGLLLLQLVVGSLAPGFSFAGITVDRNRLVVDAPSYEAMSSDGTSYAVSAAAAIAAPDSNDLIDLTTALLTMRQPDGREVTAAAETAQLQTTDQLVLVEGVARIADNRGAFGTLAGVRADIPGETMTASGAVDLTFANGATLDASGMVYAGDGTWHFTDVTLVLPALPGADATPAARAAGAEPRP
jgi:lipopolysaccharide export system protein LptC